jgi:hypothetical protein
VALLTLALVFGAVYWARDTAAVGHVKLAATVAVWVVSFAAFALRAAGRLLARGFAWTCLAIFAAALLSLRSVDESRHPQPAQVQVRSGP